MHKELIISATIIISIFILDYITQKYSDLAINEALQDLTQIKEKIKQENVDSDIIIKVVNENHEKWKKHHEKLAFYIEHNELEKVETNYVAGISFIENRRYEEALSEIEKTLFVLEHINDKYSIKWANIF